jgi:hypothetical protein
VPEPAGNNGLLRLDVLSNAIGALGRSVLYLEIKSMRVRVAGWCLMLLVLAGCKKKDGERDPTPSGPFTVYVSVTNQGFFDVNVYLMRANDAFGRRLGTVTGNSSQTFRFPDTELQSGGRLQVGARSIGSRSSWVSPTLSVGPGTLARLVLVSSPSGDLARSQFFPESGSF